MILLLCFGCLLVLDLIYLGNCGDLFFFYSRLPRLDLGRAAVPLTL